MLLLNEMSVVINEKLLYSKQRKVKRGRYLLFNLIWMNYCCCDNYIACKYTYILQNFFKHLSKWNILCHFVLVRCKFWNWKNHNKNQFENITTHDSPLFLYFLFSNKSVRKLLSYQSEISNKFSTILLKIMLN